MSNEDFLTLGSYDATIEGSLKLNSRGCLLN